MGKKLHNIPVSMDDDFLTEIDRLAEAKNQTRSAIMRDAIRSGLEIVKSGGSADVLTVDSELSREVDALAAGHNRKRNSILLDAMRQGLRAVDVALMVKKARSEGIEEGAVKSTEIAHELDLFPEKAEAKKAMLERYVYQKQVDDLVRHVPAARERKEAIEKLIKLRTEAGQWRTVWGCGLSTEEIKWQIAMHENYGHDSTKWPKSEIDRHKTELEELQAERTAAKPPKKAKSSAQSKRKGNA